MNFGNAPEWKREFQSHDIVLLPKRMRDDAFWADYGFVWEFSGDDVWVLPWGVKYDGFHTLVRLPKNEIEPIRAVREAHDTIDWLRSGLEKMALAFQQQRMVTERLFETIDACANDPEKVRTVCRDFLATVYPNLGGDK